MFIDDCTYTRNGKTYRRVLLRNSYRVDGTVRHDTLANLSQCADEEIEAIKFGLRHKGQLAKLAQRSQTVFSPGLGRGGGGGAVPTGPVSGSGKGLGKGATGVVVPVVGLRHRDRPRLAFIGRAAGPAACRLRCPEARSG